MGRFGLKSLAIPCEQVAYSLNNFLFTIACARAMSLIDFGQFALFSAFIILFVGLQRAVITEPLMILASKYENTTLDGKILSAYLLFCLIFAVPIVFVVCMVFYFFMGWSQILYSIPLVILIFVNDYSRFIYIIQRKVAVLLANTIAVSFVQIATIVFLQRQFAVRAETAAYVWGGSALIGVVSHIAFLRTPVRSAWRTLTLVRENLKLGGQFGLDYFLGIATTQGVLLAATAVTGPAAAAALRGADSLVGPVRILLQSMPALLLPQSHKIIRAEGGVVRAILLLIMVLCGMVAVWDIVILSIPDSIGAKVLGKSWSVVRPILPWVVIALFSNVVVALSALGLKLLRRGDALAKSRLKLLPFGLVLSIGGAFYAGAEGGAIGAMLTSVVGAIIWFRGFLVIARKAAYESSHY